METRKQTKARLQAAGVWDQFVAERQKLIANGMSPKLARTQALAEVETKFATAECPDDNCIEPLGSEAVPQFGQQVPNNEAVQWVGQNLANFSARPVDAPGGAAWGLLLWVRKSPVNESTFWGSIWPKTLPTAAALRQQTKDNSKDLDDDKPCPTCGREPDPPDEGTERLRALIPKVLAEVQMRANSMS